MTIPTLVYVVTYRMPNDPAQTELLKYTKESADAAAKTIIEMGGVAVVTEDERIDSPSEEPDIHPIRSLKW